MLTTLARCSATTSRSNYMRVAQPPAVDNPYVTEVVLRTRPC